MYSLSTDTVKLTNPSEDVLWPHVDVNPFIEGGQNVCYQGIVYVWASDENSSTTVVLPESHGRFFNRFTSDLAERLKRSKHHYVSLPMSYRREFLRSAVRVQIPAGGMIVWNSRCVHQGWNIGPRLALPVCMQPSNERSCEALERKVEAVVTGCPTTHWATLGYFHGSAGVRECGGTKEVPLKLAAHKWLLSETQGGVLPNSSILALL
eukprot:CAMPEP_0176417446 /NCGR_PEP_ID=MMETSP0127-20121128/6896_1 /TAXON_ID=938130 /ORGANISM="Platyophrya macrostoma, Strain WH" /LENGTH=207 /DNA_ID=CAMNT_0017797613 /DNA_START=165 /DNA_END=788 /DNA_ORIENTATION=+